MQISQSWSGLQVLVVSLGISLITTTLGGEFARDTCSTLFPCVSGAESAKGQYNEIHSTTYILGVSCFRVHFAT
jgi:hypothetical protein